MASQMRVNISLIRGNWLFRARQDHDMHRGGEDFRDLISFLMLSELQCAVIDSTILMMRRCSASDLADRQEPVQLPCLYTHTA